MSIFTPLGAAKIWLTGIWSWPSHESGAYVKLFENLAACIREGAELAVKWAEATDVVQLVELAHQSAREGKTLTVDPL